jgi:hypothetical protein
VHIVDEPFSDSVAVALDLGLASKAITAMGPTDAHWTVLAALLAFIVRDAQGAYWCVWRAAAMIGSEIGC